MNENVGAAGQGVSITGNVKHEERVTPEAKCRKCGHPKRAHENALGTEVPCTAGIERGDDLALCGCAPFVP